MNLVFYVFLPFFIRDDRKMHQPGPSQAAGLVYFHCLQKRGRGPFRAEHVIT
jgi:hypothetical protein